MDQTSTFRWIGATIARRIRTIALLPFILFLLSGTAIFAQDAVPKEILQRTLFIKAGDEGGTAFQIDRNGKLYLVTARHVVAGLPTTGATIQVWQSDKWADYKTIRTLFPASDDVDIAVLETDEKVSQPFQIQIAGKTSGGPTFGQPVWFLGYPYGLGSRIKTAQGDYAEMPFIKRGTMSAIDASNPQAVVLYIDGFNNPGFSGGPILYWSFSDQNYKLLGVVKGYKEDTAKVLLNGKHVDTQLLVNSGILIAYSITHAIEAIDADQKR
jgi:hypothetical protein